MISVQSERDDAAAVLKELVNSLTAATAYIEAVRHCQNKVLPQELTAPLDKVAAQCKRAGVAVQHLQSVLRTYESIDRITFPEMPLTATCTMPAEK